ncbi:MAG: MarR family transcriptional regulator [Chloroflexaceae bacterium]|nr:MarR family transcriptional regulator [Chloroflexaceae bacterium]
MTSDAISDTLGHLFAQTSKMMRNYACQQMAELGLYPGQQMILAVLWQQDGVTPTFLASEIQVQPPTMTRMLRRLEEMGLVHRQPCPADQRTSRVCLTDAGRAIQQQLETVWMQLEETIFANFRVEERILLRRLLLQMQHNVKDASAQSSRPQACVKEDHDILHDV